MISERLRLAIRSLLTEGFLDDLAQKTDRGDELRVASEQAIEHGLPLDKQRSYLQWMLKVAGSEPFGDIVGDLVTHFKTKQSGRLKGPDADINTFKNVGDLRRKLEAFASQASSNQGQADIIGKFGQWIVYMPHDKESSCQLGVGTTWCTAKKSGQNLFYNYVGRDQIILYYVIKDGVDPQTEPTSKLSLGVVDGRIILDGQNGHVSVDADNKGLTEKRVNQILGPQNDSVLHAIESHAKSISGKHPAQGKIEQMRKNWPTLQAAIKDLDDEARRDLLKLVFEGDVVPEVLTKLSHDQDRFVRQRVAYNVSTPGEVLIKLSQDQDRFVRHYAARNPSVPSEMLIKLSQDQDIDVRLHIAQNPNTPIEALIKLSQDHVTVRRRIAYNPNTPSEILTKLSQDRDVTVRLYVATKTKTPIEALIKLSQDQDVFVRRSVAEHPNMPSEILTKLSQDQDITVRQNAKINLANRSD